MKKMEVVKNEKDSLEILVKEDIGIGNKLVTEMLKSKKVEFAAATIDHPLKGNLILKVKADNPKKELLAAIEQVQADLKKLSGSIK